MHYVNSPISQTSVKDTDRHPRKSSHTRQRDSPMAIVDIIVEPRDLEKKSVAFSPIIRYRTVKHINEYSPDEFETTWYTEIDLQIVLQECVTTVRRMVRKKPLQEEAGFCSRGLEYKTPSGSKFRKGNKTYAIARVMEEQRMQKGMGMYDPEYLSEIYCDATKNSKRLAHLMALRDEKEALPLLQSKSSITLLRKKKQMRASSPTSSPTSAVDECTGSYRRGSSMGREKKSLFPIGENRVSKEKKAKAANVPR